MKSVFIVILDYNSHDQTHDLLKSLKNIDTKNLDTYMVIIDNASEVPFVFSPKEISKNVHLLRNKKNLGFSGGNNIGIDYALSHGADFVVLLNNDTLVDKNFLHILIERLEKNNEIGLVVPKIYFAKGYEYHKNRYKKGDLGKVLWYAGGSIDWNNMIISHEGLDDIDTGAYDKEKEVDFATGCCMAIKREVLERVHGFDSRYFLYLEDADLTERIKKAGYGVKYIPSAVIWHKNAASSGGAGSALHDYYLTRNRLLFGFTYAPLRTKLALIRESVKLLKKGSKWQKIAVRDFYMRKFGKGSFAL